MNAEDLCSLTGVACDLLYLLQSLLPYGAFLEEEPLAVPKEKLYEFGHRVGTESGSLSSLMALAHHGPSLPHALVNEEDSIVTEKGLNDL